jgi:hypothetical protein
MNTDLRIDTLLHVERLCRRIVALFEASAAMELIRAAYRVLARLLAALRGNA